jgi:putative restriction endonuclease
MNVSFDFIYVGKVYSRSQLVDLWKYKGTQAISRGVVTPQNTNKIILFVTKEKQKSATQYRDFIQNNQLFWEGPNDHFAEDRIINSSQSGDEIHLFYRERYNMDFTYYGILVPIPNQFRRGEPSCFVFTICNYK